MLPDGWKLSCLGKISGGELQTGPFGSQLYAHEYQDQGCAVLMPKNLVGYRADISSAAKISKERAAELKRHVLYIGDILFSRRGDVSRLALIDANSAGSLCGTGCLRARLGLNAFPGFFFYFLQLDTIKTWLESNAVGQTMLNLNTEILFQLPLLLPPLSEQKKIAAILSTWDRATEVTEKLLANSQQQKKALMQQLLIGKKRLPGFTGEWRTISLEKIGRIYSGGTPNTEDSTYWNGDIFWLTPTEVTSLSGKYVSNTKLKITVQGMKNSSATLIPKGSVVVCTRATIGFMAITSCDLTTNQGFKNIVPFEGFYPEFVYYSLMSKQHTLRRLASGSTFPEISRKDFGKIELVLPLIEEQKAIASVLTKADEEITLLKADLSRLRQEKKALMQQLLTGKRRVKLEADAG